MSKSQRILIGLVVGAMVVFLQWRADTKKRECYERYERLHGPAPIEDSGCGGE
jgi:hypothetical protein